MRKVGKMENTKSLGNGLFVRMIRGSEKIFATYYAVCTSTQFTAFEL